MIFRMATADDIDSLITVRFDYFKAENWEVTDEKKVLIQSQLQRYYPAHLNLDFFAGLAVDNACGIASVAFLAISEKPANLSFPTGRTGTILNVLTYPQYRNMGYATEVLKLNIAEAKRQELSFIELSASEMGKPLYKKLGFQELKPLHFTEMRLALL